MSSATAICQKMTEEIKRTAKNDRSKDKTVLWFVILKAIINKWYISTKSSNSVFFPFVFQFEKQERRKHMSDGLGANLFRRVLIKIQQ